MNLPYFFEESITNSTKVLSEETSKHCVQVLRMKAGGRLKLTDGKGNLFTATIMEADKRHCTVQVEATIHDEPNTQNVCIAISLLKNTSRFEWFLEKATEIGVKEIIPLICHYTERENFRLDRMNNILIAAMLQSEQTWLPKLHQPKKFNAFINEDIDGLKLIAHCIEEEEKQTLQEIASQHQNKLILIGPEGDFSPAEIKAAFDKKFIPVTLGKTRLRTETAGIVAATLLINTY